jgi:2-polyprenyl-6-methoxyphenol hydroxylase-like FAD-dependent oxidoreductase
VNAFSDRDPSLAVNPNVPLDVGIRLHDAPSLVGKAGPDRDVDVAIAGGGLAGSLAAVVLGRAGYRVAVVDMHRVYPPEFRCEKLAGDQLGLLRELGLFDCLTAVGKPIKQMYVARFGKLVDRMNSEEHGFFYDEFVNVVRARFPSNVEFVIGRVADFETSSEMQRIVLSSGEAINARLIVLASGLGDALRQRLGIKRRVIRDAHSLSIGFSAAPASDDEFDFPALTYYGERTSERIAYLSLFPAGDGMRGNLFCYRGQDGAWARSFRDKPQETLFGAMPGLSRFIGDFHVVGKVKIRVADLYQVENHYREGVALVGDAFQTTCPAAGNGVTRVLTDVGRLCKEYVPRWFATPGMGAEKIAQFYDDPVKQACDARCAWLAEYCRLFAIDNGPMWQARRWRAYLRPQLRGWVNLSGIRRADRNYAKRLTMLTKLATKESVSRSERILQSEDSF